MNIIVSTNLSWLHKVKFSSFFFLFLFFQIELGEFVCMCTRSFVTVFCFSLSRFPAEHTSVIAEHKSPHKFPMCFYFILQS